MASLPNDTSSNSEEILQFQSPLQESFIPNNNRNDSHPKTTALIILNSPISKPPSLIFQHLWDISSVRICADGGANRLYDASFVSDHPSSEPTDSDNNLSARGKDCRTYIPDYIRGDLDSLRSDVRTYYQNLGKTVIERDSCQDTNDFDKALQVCVSTVTSANGANSKGEQQEQQHESSLWCMPPNKMSKFDRIVVFGAFGGRFDQEMASIQALYKWGPIFRYQLYLYTDETCAWLLPGDHTKCEILLPFYGPKQKLVDQHPSSASNTEFPGKVFGEGPTCGLIPIGCKCNSVITSGLKWDLDGTIPLEFGGLVSSSNHAEKERISVSSSDPIVFTAEVVTVEPSPHNENVQQQRQSQTDATATVAASAPLQQ